MATRPLTLGDGSIVRVFEYIEESWTLVLAVPLVCRSWREACCCGLGKFQLDLRREHAAWPGFSDAALQAAILKRFSSIRELQLPASAHLTDAGFQGIALEAKRLTSLKVKHVGKISEAGIEHIATGCQNLTFLQCPLQISDQGLRFVAKHLPKLSGLCLQRCTRVTNDGLQSLAEGCLELAYLDLSGTLKISNNGLAHVATRSKKLTKLKINNCLGTITDDIIQRIAEGCAELTALSASSSQIVDAGLACLAKHCPKLSKLNLTCCHQITDEGLRRLSDRNCQLTSLSITDCLISDVGLRSLATAGCKMSKLVLAGCRKVSGVGILELASASLSKLDVSDCKGIDDKFLIGIAGRCPNLHRLGLIGCRKVSDSGLCSVADHCRNLKELDLGDCCKVTDVSLQKIGANCPRLQRINLISCNRVTIAGVRLLPLGCSVEDFCELEEGEEGEDYAEDEEGEEEDDDDDDDEDDDDDGAGGSLLADPDSEGVDQALEDGEEEEEEEADEVEEIASWGNPQ
ncbi:unnamed protein product [Polarella glacialis]|uniref:F-box/LRR-repeat protein 15-like leucin rich repeat domain-containing protein n=1 Tax=Polarella glacialis TaxID=89957 RepID=A0A813G641_POLGL|nr:unnamed protein product [Polarella glacialis]